MALNTAPPRVGTATLLIGPLSSHPAPASSQGASFSSSRTVLTQPAPPGTGTIRGHRDGRSLSSGTRSPHHDAASGDSSSAVRVVQPLTHTRGKYKSPARLGPIQVRAIAAPGTALRHAPVGLFFFWKALLFRITRNGRRPTPYGVPRSPKTGPIPVTESSRPRTEDPLRLASSCV
jgi:hypothetical protein